jgi:hypothetical protein
VSFVNTVLNSITADAFARFATAIEGGKPPQQASPEPRPTCLQMHTHIQIHMRTSRLKSWRVSEAPRAETGPIYFSLKAPRSGPRRSRLKSWRVPAFASECQGAQVASEALGGAWKSIFNGDGYSEAWREESGKRGVWRIDSGVEAVQRLADDKNVGLFQSLGVLTREETDARRVVMLGHYAGTVEMEAGCMVDMIRQSIVPAVAGAGQDTAALSAAAESVAAGLGELHHAKDALDKARKARELRLETMERARKVCDEAEGRCPADAWPFATYKELLFLDTNQDGAGRTLDARGFYRPGHSASHAELRQGAAE